MITLLQDIVKRDQTVVEMMKQYKIPIAMLLGGGYQVDASFCMFPIKQLFAAL